MKIGSYITSVVIGALIYGAAGARTIEYDAGQWSSLPDGIASSVSNSSAALSIDGDELSFSVSPGVTSDDTLQSVIGFNSGLAGTTDLPANLASASSVVGYEFNWGSAPGPAQSPGGISEQVIVYVASPTLFDVSINYADPSVDVGCGNENAVFSMSPTGGGAGTSYSAHGACSVSTNANLFEFSGNQLINATPGTNSIAGWSASATSVSAPEIDAKSAIAGLTLLLGVIAVMRGRGQVSRIAT